MNKQIRRMAVGLGLVAWPALGWGQSPPPSLPGKIGVINIQAAIAGTGEGKKAFAELEKRYAPRRQELQQLQQEINALTDQLQKQATTLSDDEQRRLNRELQEKQTRFKRMQEDAQADFQADNGDVVNRIGQKMVRQAPRPPQRRRSPGLRLRSRQTSPSPEGSLESTVES